MAFYDGLGHPILNRNANGGIEPVQRWTVNTAPPNQRRVEIIMGGLNNTCAQKHLLDPTRKPLVHTDQDKLTNRLWHRVDKIGAQLGNPDPGLKANAADRMTRSNKYGSALK